MVVKPERVLAVVIGVVVLVAVVAGIVAATRPSNEFQPGTPEAAVQGFVQALIDGDASEAADFLASASDCDVGDVERARGLDPARVLLQNAETENGTVRVTVDVVTGSGGGPFDLEEYSQSHTYVLVQEGEEWRITNEPWPLFSCRGDDR